MDQVWQICVAGGTAAERESAMSAVRRCAGLLPLRVSEADAPGGLSALLNSGSIDVVVLAGNVGHLTLAEAARQVGRVLPGAGVVGPIALRDADAHWSQNTDAAGLVAILRRAADAGHCREIANDCGGERVARGRAYDALPAGLWRGDTNGLIFEASAGLNRLIGRSAIAEPPEALLDLFADPPQGRRLLDMLRTEGQCSAFGAELFRDDGTMFFAEIDANVIGDADASWLIEGSIVDRTAARKRQRQAAAVTRRWQTLADEAPGGLVAVSMPGGAIEWANALAAELLGKKAEDLVGEVFFDKLAPDAAARFRRDVLAEIGLQIDTDEPMRDGERWLHLTGRIIRDRAGNPRRLAILLSDVTARRRDAERQREARRAAESSSAVKDQFLAQLSHELRVPLAPALAATQLVAEHPELPAALRDDVESIRRNIDLQARLIDDLLDLNRAMTGKLLLRNERFDPCDLVKEAIDICRGDAKQADIQLRVDCDGAAGEMVGDRTRLVQVLWNLVKNAIKFTPSGGEVVTQVVREQDRSRDEIVFRVTDTGIGMESAMLPRVFEAFEQGDRATTGGKAGLGLGLTVARSIVLLHGGQVTADSKGAGLGSTFTVRLPASPTSPTSPTSLADDQAGLDDAAPSQEIEETDSVVPSGRVLLVDDHVETSKLLARLIKRAGYDVEIAHDLGGARTLLRESDPATGGEPFAAVVCDLDLPDGRGHELARELGDRDAASETDPVVLAVSGFGSASDVEEALAAGFDAHLTKPVSMDVLLATLARLLRKRQAAGARDAMRPSAQMKLR